MGFKQMIRTSNSSTSTSSDVDRAAALATLTAPQLVLSLENSFRSSDFEVVAKMLESREESLKSSKMELESQCKSLEVQLQEAKERLASLEAEFGDLELHWFVAKEELEKQKRVCGLLEEQVCRRDEDYRVASEREKKAQEKIADLMAELEKKEQELKEWFIELKTENQDLQCAKRRARDEAKQWKRKYEEVEAMRLRSDEETWGLRKKQEMALRNSEIEVSGKACEMVGGFRDDGIINCSDNEEDDDIKGRILEDRVLVENREEGASSQKGATKRNFEQRNADIICMPRDADIAEEADYKFTITPGRKRCSRVISSESEGQSDDDDDDKIPIGKLKTKRLQDAIGSIEEQQNFLVTKSSGLDDASDIMSPSEECSGLLQCCGEPGIVARDSLATAVIADYGGYCDFDNMSSRGSVTVSHKVGYSNHDAAEKNEALAIKEMNDGDAAKGEYEKVDKFTMKESNYLEAKSNLKKGAAGNRDSIANERHGRKQVNDGKVSKAKDDKCDDFTLKKSSSFQAKYSARGAHQKGSAGNQDINCDETTSSREKMEIKWQCETDLYCSLMNDPELCMKAVCAIYRQQPSLGKLVRGTPINNRRGFSAFDTFKASKMAEFLMDGDRQGPLKKSIQELEEHDRRGVDYCCKLASSYSNQLFMIYEKKEDPFFP